MTYEECMGLVEAYASAVELCKDMERDGAHADWLTSARQVRDYIGETIGSLMARYFAVMERGMHE